MKSSVFSAMLVAILATATSCNRVQGSCDQRATQGQCKEVTASTIKDQVEHTCKSSLTATERGTWSTKACDRTGAIAGCESSLSREWYYPNPTSNVQTVGHVAQLCFLGKVLDANGKVLKDVKAEKLSPQAANDPELVKLVASMPALEATVAAIEKIRLSGSPGTVRPSGGKHVTAGAVVYERDLNAFADRNAADETTLPLNDADDFHACGVAVRAKDRRGKNDADLKRLLTWCASLPYLLVVRTAHLEMPASRSGSDFIGGKADGVVFVYELPSGKSAGVYSFKSESSAKVRSNELDSDFRLNFAKALTAGLAKADPGATLAVQVNPSRK